MSLLEYGVQSNWPEEHLETMKREFKLGAAMMESKLFHEMRAQMSTGAFQPQMVDVSYLPITVPVGSEGVPLPVAVIEEIIRRSPHRIISKTCTCRDALDCKEHSKFIGCIHIGEATAEESDGVCYHVTVEEAIEHLHKAVDDGLMPYVGHFGLDHVYWDVNFARPFLTVCFCCECCCQNFAGYRHGVFRGEAENAFKLLDGLHVNVDTTKCVGCGTCEAKCFNHAIKVVDGKATWDESRCKGCSSCAIHCPQKAIEITIDDVKGAVDKFLKRIEPQVGGLPLDEYQLDL